MDPAASDSLSRVESYSGYRSAALPVAYGTLTLCGTPFQVLQLGITGPKCGPTTPGCYPWFGLLRVRSPLLTESIFLSLPTGTEMFQFPALARAFRDQSSFDNSPGLIAVFHALSPPGAKTSPTRPY
jgi:hypothetical protein